MPYKVELNRFAGTSRLVYYATIPRGNIKKRGEWKRRIIEIGGREYHVTEGWRGLVTSA